MLSTLYLLRFNNYYNRVLKRYDTLSEYEPYMLGSAIQNVNFIPNDGVYAKQVINWDNEIPDYLLVVNGTNTIVSRWFVIESRRALSGQFELGLFRDCLADYLNEIKYAPMFVEKGMLRPGNSLIYNSENMSYSQVKTSETLLKDRSKSAWLIGYCDSSKDLTNTDNNSQVYYADSSFTDRTDVTTIADSTQWTYYNCSTLAPSPTPIRKALKNATFGAFVNYSTSYFIPNKTVPGFFMWASNSSVPFEWRLFGADGSATPVPASGVSLTAPSNNIFALNFEQAARQMWDQMAADLPGRTSLTLAEISEKFATTFPNLMSTSIEKLEGKIYYFTNLNRAYKVHVTMSVGSGRSTDRYVQPLTRGSELWNLINQAVSGSVISGTPNNESYFIGYQAATYTLEMEPITIETTRMDISPAAQRRHLSDAPYDMFAIPLDPIVIKSYYGGTFTTHVNQVNTDAVLSCVQELARINGVGTDKPIYDIQILPYCPFPELINADGQVTLPGTDSAVDYRRTYTNIDAGSLNEEGVWTTTMRVGVVIYCDRSSFTNTISYRDPSELTNEKIRSEVEVYRLVSPNYNGCFEWNQVKNGGFNAININFDISCTYKPITPFIQVAPQFGGLYGQTFSKDNRGLICGGDFSMPVIADAWSQYQQQNRNYQAIFDRQIENMEIKNDYQRTQELYSAVTGTISGGISGAASGATKGGVYGAIAGAVVGTATSAAGAALDWEIKEGLRAEALDYTKDMYGYQLGNIRALPNGLAKVSAFNINNKNFPALEYYVATEEEITALTNKIANNGMTIMAIGSMAEYSEYKPTEFSITDKQENTYVYVKGKLIRLEIDEDYHLANIISGELNKGVFV